MQLWRCTGELDLELEDLEGLREDRGAPVEVQWRGLQCRVDLDTWNTQRGRVSFTNCAF